MADMVQVAITDSATTIHLTAGDADDEPSEVLYDILAVVAGLPGHKPEPEHQAFARALCGKMDAAIFGK